jgi:L-threonylcarbamoyladenylate synthase
MRLPPDPASIARAARALVEGDIVGFPTETVYGLGARADRSEAVLRIYEKKGRPPENPSIVHAATADAALALADGVPAGVRDLAAALWPGPLTLVLPVRSGAVAPEVTARGPTIAVRVPAHPVALALLEACSLPVAAPSANRSSTISPTTAEHVEKSLGADFLVLDAGPTGFGIESTIVDVTADPWVILRRGSIRMTELSSFHAVVDRADAVTGEGVRLQAPGGLARHYAPRVPLSVVPRRDLVGADGVGFVVLAPPPEGVASGALVEVLPADPVRYARALYAALHRLEDAGAKYIVVEQVPDESAWSAIRDRLTRAAR